MTTPPVHGRNPFASAAPAPAVPGQAAASPGYGLGQGPRCACCGAFPAVDATLRTHVGLLIVMRTDKLPGPFCRDCGISLYRDLTDATLKKGWWSAWSLLMNPVVMLANLRVHRKLAALGAPVPGAPRPPRPIGPPVHKRWSIWLLAIPAGLLLTMLTSLLVTVLL